MQVLLGQVYGDYTGGTPGWHLHQGSGARFFDMAVAFQSPLIGSPLVQINLAALDSDGQHNLRVTVNPINVTNVGFTVRISTWADTKLYAVRASWIAVTP
jgi:hypothetical protein